MHRSVWRIVLQLTATALLFGLLWYLCGGDAIAQRLSHLDPLWLTIGLLLNAPGTIAAALRWCYTASCVGAPIRRSAAIAEFYLSALLNQVLPSGIAGDAVRAWRHSRTGTGEGEQKVGAGPAVRSVLIERVSNPVMFAPWLVISLILWPGLPNAQQETRLLAPLLGGSALLVLAVVVALYVARRLVAGQIELFLADARRALLVHPSLLIQLGLSCLLTMSNLAVFYCAARALSAPLSVYELLALVPPVLLSMTIPLSIGGWGLREATAAGLWALAGIPPSDALAISILYGTISLLGSLPGALVPFFQRRQAST